MIKDCVVSILLSVSLEKNSIPATATVPLDDFGNGAACFVLDRTAVKFQDCSVGVEGIEYNVEVKTISDERLTIGVNRVENQEYHLTPRRSFIAADLYLNGFWDMGKDDLGFGWEVELLQCPSNTPVS